MTDQDWLAQVGPRWVDSSPWAFLTELTELDDRMGGHPGEHTAADLVAESLDAAGARATAVEPFTIRRWTRGDTTLRVTAPVEREFEAIALPYSPAATLDAELVDVGHGTPAEVDAADVDGKLVVASTATPSDSPRVVHRMEKFGHAAEAGAVGFIFVNHVPGQLPPTGALSFDGEAPIPAVGVSRETGAWLTDYADRDARVSLTVEAATDEGRSHNVVGLFGPATDEEVVAVAHYDAHDVAEGALDNGCGIAVLVTAARLLAALDLDLQVRLVGVGSEEIGLKGSTALAESLDLDAVRAVVNVDGAGRFRDLRAFTQASPGMDAVVERVGEASGQPIDRRDHVHPYSDHWPFLRRGVPALQLHSTRSTPDAAVGASTADRGRGWGHTSADTRDKVDVRNLREHAILAALFVRELAGRPPLDRPSPNAVARRLRDADYRPGMQAAGIWPDDWE